MHGYLVASGVAVTLLFGVPIGAGLGLVGLAIMYIEGSEKTLAVLSVWNAFNTFTFSALPLFLYMGEVLLKSGISTKVYNAVGPIFTRVPGQLLHTNIAACAAFGAVSGASMSTAAAIGSTAYPELKERGYHKGAVVGTLAAGGTLGLLIPPSLAFVIYGAMMEVSIGDLFLAGIIPGLILASLFSMVVLVKYFLNRDIAPDVDNPQPLGAAILGLLKIWPFAILIFSVLGVIYLGVATPTEAAGIGFMTAIVMGFAWGELTITKLKEALVSATINFCAIIFVVAGALILAQAISVIALPTQIVSAISAWGFSPLGLFAVICVVYIILGTIFDGVSLMLVTLPVVFPVLTSVGFDPIWLGVAVVILVELGMLTPPVGINLFVISGITRGDVSVMAAAKEAIPFWFCMIAMIGILILFPSIALWLPSL